MNDQEFEEMRKEFDRMTSICKLLNDKNAEELDFKLYLLNKARKFHEVLKKDIKNQKRSKLKLVKK